MNLFKHESSSRQFNNYVKFISYELNSGINNSTLR